MHHNQTKEGLQRHIKILTRFEELKSSGFSGNRSTAARQISRETGIGDTSVYGTLYSHEGKLERFTKELRELDGETVASSVEPVVNELKILWKSLLAIIATEGCSMEQEWYEAVGARLGLNNKEELIRMMDTLFDNGLLRKLEVGNEDGGQEGFFYLVTPDGKLVAKGERDMVLEGEEPSVVEEEMEEPSTVEQLTEVLRYIRNFENGRPVPVTSMHFRNMQIYLGFSQEQLNNFVKELEGADFLKIVENGGVSHLELTDDGYAYMQIVIAKERQNILEDQEINAVE